MYIAFFSKNDINIFCVIILKMYYTKNQHSATFTIKLHVKTTILPKCYISRFGL